MAVASGAAIVANAIEVKIGLSTQAYLSLTKYLERRRITYYYPIIIRYNASESFSWGY